MFGATNNGSTPGSNVGRPAAAEVARIESGVAYVLVGREKSDGVLMYVNGNIIPNGTLESLSLNIVAPTNDDAQGTVTAILNFHETATDGQPMARSVALFPGTVEVVARNQRITVTAQEAHSFDGLWLGLGLAADGTSRELTGVQALRVTVTPDIVDAKLTWSEDGTTEDLLPSEDPFPKQGG